MAYYIGRMSGRMEVAQMPGWATYMFGGLEVTGSPGRGLDCSPFESLSLEEKKALTHGDVAGSGDVSVKRSVRYLTDS